MKKNSLKTKGLSLSQAQSVSNSCNQQAIEIFRIINEFNNYSSVITVDGTEHTLVEAKQIPVTKIVDMIDHLGNLTATQAFLMENIKAKDSLLKEIRVSKLDRPERPTCKCMETPNLLDTVNEEFGWSKLSEDEINEFYSVEAKASAIGKFIHKEGKLTKLRDELPKVASIDWIEIETGKKTPVIIKKHHTNESLMELYDILAKKHRELEQRVNYFKSKVKNLTLEENARITKENALELARVEKINSDIAEEYHKDFKAWNDLVDKLENEFETKRQKKTKAIVDLRIEIPERFKHIVDELMDAK